MPQTLKDFAFLPDFYSQLDRLAGMTLPEPWCYSRPEKERFNQTTHILEKHLYLTFEEQMRRREYAEDKNAYVYIGESDAAFNTGLLTPLYQDVYARFELNRNPQFGRMWALTSFGTEASAALSGIPKLPKPLRFFPDTAYGFHPDWPLRLNLEHMLYSEDNLNRLPTSIRTLSALAQTIEACAEQSMRRARYTPGIDMEGERSEPEGRGQREALRSPKHRASEAQGGAKCRSGTVGGCNTCCPCLLPITDTRMSL